MPDDAVRAVFDRRIRFAAREKSQLEHPGFSPMKAPEEHKKKLIGERHCWADQSIRSIHSATVEKGGRYLRWGNPQSRDRQTLTGRFRFFIKSGEMQKAFRLFKVILQPVRKINDSCPMKKSLSSSWYLGRCARNGGVRGGWDSRPSPASWGYDSPGKPPDTLFPAYALGVCLGKCR